MERVELGDNSKLIFGILLISIFIIITLSSNSNNVYTGRAIFEDQPDSLLGKDTYIREGLNINFQTASTLRIGKIISGVEYRALLEFNFSHITSTDTVLEANLELNLISKNNNNPITLELYRVISPWEKTQITWFKRTTSDWISEGGDYGEKINEITIPSTLGIHKIPITEMARKWVDGSRLNYGFIIIEKDANNGDYFDFGSSDSLTLEERPKLIINHMENAPPIIHDIKTDSNSTNPKKINDLLVFEINWSDMESNDAKIFICDKNDTTSNGCTKKTFCQTDYSSTNPISCSYTIKEEDKKVTDFWVSICDENGCATPTQSQFYINHAPTAELLDPNGGEHINQSQGNYSILFNIHDKDLDSLTGQIFYGEQKGEKSGSIQENINFSKYCQDTDYDPETPLECVYSWDSADVYGTYFLTILVNDSFENFSTSSENPFNVTSLIDLNAPLIYSSWLSTTNITSGKKITFNANAEDIHMKDVWATINTVPETKLILNEISPNIYSANWTAGKIGSYYYKIFASDRVGNLNQTQEKFFNILKPTLTPLIQNMPKTAMPNHLLIINAQSRSKEELKGVHASISVPEGFVFLNGYPQDSNLGDFNQNETKIATWFLSVPLTEKIYNLNISYFDSFGNTWDGQNFDLEVTNSQSRYSLELEGYPEVETSHDYYTEAIFKKDNSNIDPDSLTISLYSPAGQLTIGPATMTKSQTGKYNFTYLLGSSSTEGQWETIINATIDGISYYKNQFWKLVGGPFDVRDIRIDNAQNNNLAISVTTENTGGANKDLILTWNLTRLDNSQMLDSASETFMVPANSEKNWTIHPNTNYTGQAKITMIGYYGFDFSERAGGYRIFSITNGEITPPTPEDNGGSGGSGGSSKEKTIKNTKEISDFQIITEKTILLTRGEEKIVPITIKNIGETKLNNIIVEIEGLPKEIYLITPAAKETLNKNEKVTFNIKFLTKDTFENKYFNYVIKSNEITKKITGELKLIDIEKYLKDKINSLNQKISSLNELFPDSSMSFELISCKLIIEEADLLLSNKEFTQSKEKIEKSESCIKSATKNMNHVAPGNQAIYIFWIITWILISLLILVIYKLIKRLAVISTIKKLYSKKSQYSPQGPSFDERIKSIESRVNDLEY